MLHPEDQHRPAAQAADSSVVGPERAAPPAVLLAPSKAAPSAVSWRAVLLGLLLVPVNIYWTTVVEVRWYTLDTTSLPLFITPIFMLFLLSAASYALHRLRASWALRPLELLVIYIVLVVSSSLSAHDTLQNMFGTIGHAHHFATPENAYERLFFQYLPSWLVVSDRRALDAFYDGGASWLDPGYLHAWAWPLLSWGVLLLALVIVMLGLNVLIRKRWAEEEKLSFPLVLLPLELTRDVQHGRFFRNRAMWAGFAVASFVDIINGLHVIFPAVPEIKYIKLYDLMQHIRERPWNAMGWTPISMYPFAIGLAFFLPTDLSFSCWFFYVLAKLERVGSALIGHEALRALPFLNEQAAGAWIALAITAIWATKGHLREALRKATGLSGAISDEYEAVRYRTAGLMVLCGSLVVIGWCLEAGMTLGPIVAFFAIYLCMSIAITRVRAELGAPHETYFVNPHRIMTGLGNPRLFGKQNLAVMALMYWFNRGYRAHPMPNQLEAFKMAEQASLDSRGVFKVILLTTVWSILVTYWANLSLTYREGASARARGFKSWLGWEAFDMFLRPWLVNPSKTNWLAASFMAVGAAAIFLLKALRTRFVNLPFHPAGYALASSFAMDYFWFAFFVSWALKTTILRYWGMKAHRQGVWFCLGLIMGDYFWGSVWAIIGPALGIQTYKIYI